VMMDPFAGSRGNRIVGSVDRTCSFMEKGLPIWGPIYGMDSS